MSERFPCVALLLALATPLGLAASATRVYGEPPPDAPQPAPEAPADAPKPAAEKPKTDDTSIFKDWGMVKQRGEAHARSRAEFWAAKEVVGNNLMWLGNMWDRANDPVKASATIEKFLEYKPPPGDEKAVSANLKIRESARKKLIGIYTKAKEYDKAIAAAEKFREEFKETSDPAVVAESWDDQGRAHRLAGDDAKAIAAFTTSAQAKYVKGLLDLVDVHLGNGDLELAKAAFDIVPKDDAAGARDKIVQSLKAFVDAVGTPAPGLDKLTNVGRGEPPVLAGKPTLFYFWHMQMGLLVPKLAAAETIRRSVGDDANVVGISKYNHYNSETEKLDPNLTPEQEIDLYKKSIVQWGILVPCVVATDDVIEGMQMKYEGQFVIVDGEGKLRYMRINGEQTYDRAIAEMALKKAAAAKKPPAKE